MRSNSGRRFRGNWEEHWGALEGALEGAGGSTRERPWEEHSERSTEWSSGKDVSKLPLPCAILLSKISHVERTVGEKEKNFFLLYFLCSLPCLPF